MKKTLSTILILSLLIGAISMFAIFSSADDTTPNMNLEVAKNQVSAGDVVEVTISLGNNPGVCAITPVIVFDTDAFEVVMDGEEPKVTYDVDWASPEVATAKVSDNKLKFAYVTSDCEDISANGAFATFYFKVKEDVSKTCSFSLEKPLNTDKEPYDVAGNRKSKSYSFTLGSVNVTVSDSSDLLTYEVKDGEVTITGCDASATGVLTVPSTIDGYPVTAIAANAFNASKVTEIYLPESVDTIGNNAFANSTSLVCVDLPETVDSLGTGLFENCTSLVGAKLPSNVTSIPANTYKGCTSIETMLIPETITAIGEGAFSGCENLVVKCKENSAAATFCAQNNISYEYYTHTVEIEGEEVGVNFNGEGKVELPELYSSTQKDCVYKVLSWVDDNSNAVNVENVTPENVSSLKAVVIKLPVKVYQLVGELVPANDPLLPKGENYINGMYIQGAQIRIPSEDGKTTWGLRFINVINNELVTSLLENGEVSDVVYGTLLVPGSRYTAGDEITLAYQGVTNVPGDNIYHTAGNFKNRYFKYTACVINIPQKQFKTTLVVRPYLSFVYEGNNIVLYGEQYDTASLFTVAQMAVGENSIEDDVTKEWIEKNIINALNTGDNDTEVEF